MCTGPTATAVPHSNPPLLPNRGRPGGERGCICSREMVSAAGCCMMLESARLVMVGVVSEAMVEFLGGCFLGRAVFLYFGGVKKRPHVRVSVRPLGYPSRAYPDSGTVHEVTAARLHPQPLRHVPLRKNVLFPAYTRLAPANPP